MKTFLLCFITLLCSHLSAQTKSVEIPLSANAYLTDVSPRQPDRIGKNGIHPSTEFYVQSMMKEKSEGIPGIYAKEYAVYFGTTVKTSGKVYLKLKASKNCNLKITLQNKTYTKNIKAENLVSTEGALSVGEQQLFIAKANFGVGYQQIKIENDGKEFPEIQSLVLEGDIADTELVFVNKDFSAHFGRRGPSDHLKYELDNAEQIEWFYNEITVTPGNDVVGSYYMANGFGEGYFGIQVNSETERRVLFSVWSPFTTDNPKDIPESHKIHLLRKGDGVTTGEFGNEGSGGQSYLVFNWKTGLTYKFLNRVKPIDEKHTLYTAYFFDAEKGEWLLIASFIRPQTHTWYRGAYSFLENFIPNQGQYTRRVHFGNQWARTSSGKWMEISKAKFTADATARAKARTDYQGGVENNQFYLQNCGFFNETTPMGSEFERKPAGMAPQIDFNLLP